MDKVEAQRRFQKADKLYTYGRFEDVLLELETLEQHFPTNHRVLNAKARTLEQLGRYNESLAVCDRLLNEFQYEKIRSVRERVAQAIAQGKEAPQRAFWGNEAPAEPAAGAPAPEEPAEEEKKRRFRIKPVRLALLLIIVALMYFGYLNYWIGGGLIAAYFVFMIVIKVVFGALLKKLFSAPFKMKGKALEGANCTLHGYRWTEAPAPEAVDEDDEEEGEAAPVEPLRWVWLDVTITPQPRTDGFTHWEPGELMLLPLSKPYKGLDDMDHCYNVRDLKLVVDGVEHPDEGGKYHGPQRLKLLVGLPQQENAFKFAYYFEQFGEIRLHG